MILTTAVKEVEQELQKIKLDGEKVGSSKCVISPLRGLEVRCLQFIHVTENSETRLKRQRSAIRSLDSAKSVQKSCKQHSWRWIR